MSKWHIIEKQPRFERFFGNHPLSLTKEADLYKVYSLEQNYKGQTNDIQHHETHRSHVRPVTLLISHH